MLEKKKKKYKKERKEHENEKYEKEIKKMKNMTSKSKTDFIFLSHTVCFLLLSFFANVVRCLSILMRNFFTF